MCIQNIHILKNIENWFGQLELPDGRLNLRFWDEYRLTTWFEPYLPSFDYLGSEEASRRNDGCCRLVAK